MFEVWWKKNGENIIEWSVKDADCADANIRIATFPVNARYSIEKRKLRAQHYRDYMNRIEEATMQVTSDVPLES